MPHKVSFYTLISDAMSYLRFIRSILYGFLVGCVIFLLAVLYQTGAPTPSSKELYEVYNLKVNIANSIKKPKLVAISGSSVLFGISCKLIHEETGVPCVNAGTHAGLGVDYLLSAARAFAKPGDIVLFPLEYEHYRDNSIPTHVLIDYVFARDVNYLRSADIITQVRLISGISLERLKQGIITRLSPTKDTRKGEFSSSLNEYGDATNNRQDKMTPKEVKTIAELQPIQIGGYINSSRGMKSIRQFLDWCKKNNIKLIATWPNTVLFDSYQDTKHQKFFQSIEEFYKKDGVPVLGKPRDFMYKKSMFFDTIYHLNDRGVQYRTQQVIELIKPYLENLKK